MLQCREPSQSVPLVSFSAHFVVGIIFHVVLSLLRPDYFFYHVLDIVIWKKLYNPKPEITSIIFLWRGITFASGRNLLVVINQDHLNPISAITMIQCSLFCFHCTLCLECSLWCPNLKWGGGGEGVITSTALLYLMGFDSCKIFP